MVVVHSLSHDAVVEQFSFSHDGLSLASTDRFIMLWTAPSWERPKARIKLEPTVEKKAFSPDLRYFVFTHDDDTITLRNLPQD
jgi:hypothetical protein